MGGSRNPQAYYDKLQDERILGYCSECVAIMNEIGYKIHGVDWRIFRSARTYGLAYKKYNTIVLNQELSKEEEAAVKNTILHELAHLASPVPGHGYCWKQVCEQIHEHTGQIITRTNPLSQHSGVAEYQKTKIKYEFECPRCGCHIKYTKSTKFVKEFDMVRSDGQPKWWCAHCRKDSGEKIQFRRIK